MKSLTLGLVLAAFTPAPALADITCWYNEKGAYTGADSAPPGYAVGKVVKGDRPTGDYAFGFTVAGGPDTCPKTLPSIPPTERPKTN